MKTAIEGQVPGVGLGFTQPIEMRFNELIAGSRSDLAIKIFGEDLDRLKETAEATARAIEKVPGAADVKVEQIAGLPILRVVVDRDQIARYGLAAEDVLAIVETIRAGRKSTLEVGDVRREVIELQRQNRELRRDLDAIKKKMETGSAPPAKKK